MNEKKGYVNTTMREGEMTTCILNEGGLKYNKQDNSYSLESPIKGDDIVMLDTKRDNTYELYYIPFVRKAEKSSPSAIGVVISEPLWQELPSEQKDISDWRDLRNNHYFRIAVVYLLRPIAVVNDRYLCTSDILKEFKKQKKENKMTNKNGTGPSSKSTGPRAGRGGGKGAHAKGKGTGKKTGGKNGGC